MSEKPPTTQPPDQESSTPPSSAGLEGPPERRRASDLSAVLVTLSRDVERHDLLLSQHTTAIQEMRAEHEVTRHRLDEIDQHLTAQDGSQSDVVAAVDEVKGKLLEVSGKQSAHLTQTEALSASVEGLVQTVEGLAQKQETAAGEQARLNAFTAAQMAEAAAHSQKVAENTAAVRDLVRFLAVGGISAVFTLTVYGVEQVAQSLHAWWQVALLWVVIAIVAGLLVRMFVRWGWRPGPAGGV